MTTDTSASISPVSLVTTSRDPRYIVRIEGIPSRADGDAFQIAIPVPLHAQLRVQIEGSLSQGIVALARYGLEFLDHANWTLKIHHSNDPLLRGSPHVREEDIRPDGYSTIFSTPHRDTSVIASINGRVSRQNTVRLLIGLPEDLKNRLRTQGEGAIGQLLVYLARYGLLLLDRSRETLVVKHTPIRVVERELVAPVDLRRPRIADIVSVLLQYPQDRHLTPFEDTELGYQYQLICAQAEDGRYIIKLQRTKL
ncbi:MAG: hypothetical protein NVV60_00240 [Luteimonas sp.]|nr:hypothetical protein [Luteimonas sp.]